MHTHPMLFDGLSKRFAKQLLTWHIDGAFTDDNLRTFYDRDPHIIDVTLFRDSFFAIRFANVFIDCIKHQHRDLPYILRNQYTGAEQLYNAATSCTSNIALTTLLSQGLLSAYFADVMKYIIAPSLLKHGMYSPNLCVMIFIELYRYMLCTYNKDSTFERMTLEDLGTTRTATETLAGPTFAELLVKEKVGWDEVAKGYKKHIRS